MHHRFRLVACGALVGAASLALFPSGVATAKTKPNKGTCATLNGNATSQTMTGCTDTVDTGGSGVSTTTHETLSGTTGVSGTDSVAWHSGLTSTESFTGTLKSGKADKCRPSAGQTNLYEVKEKGSVTGGTAVHLVGSKTKGMVCVFTASSGPVVKNFPGKPTSF
jgi:hypothetical protein